MKFQMKFPMSQTWKDRFKINTALIPAKVVYFVYGLGKLKIFKSFSEVLVNSGFYCTLFSYTSDKSHHSY